MCHVAGGSPGSGGGGSRTECPKGKSPCAAGGGFGTLGTICHFGSNIVAIINSRLISG